MEGWWLRHGCICSAVSLTVMADGATSYLIFGSGGTSPMGVGDASAQKTIHESSLSWPQESGPWSVPKGDQWQVPLTAVPVCLYFQFNSDPSGFFFSVGFVFRYLCFTQPSSRQLWPPPCKLFEGGCVGAPKGRGYSSRVCSESHVPGSRREIRREQLYFGAALLLEMVAAVAARGRHLKAS